jgi:hypothetical protein
LRTFAQEETKLKAQSKSATLDEGHIPYGRLRYRNALILSPAEVEFAFRQFTLQEVSKIQGQWMLAGIASDELFASLESQNPKEVLADLSVHSIGSGAAYAVLTCQSGALQHRFVLPLYEPRVAELFASVKNQSFRIYFENDGATTKGAAYGCPVNDERFEKARALCQVVDIDSRARFVVDFPTDVARILSLELAPSLNDERVRMVDASVFLPQAKMSFVRSD